VLTRQDLIRRTTEQTGLPLVVVNRCIIELLKIIRKALIQGDMVLLSGIGRFRTTLNATKTRRYLRFRSSPAMKKAMMDFMHELEAMDDTERDPATPTSEGG
jgi:nucleoid DNA-binding protein